MKRPFALLGPVAAAMLATAACASSSPYAAAPSAQASPAPSVSPVAVSPAASGTEIQVGSSRLGEGRCTLLEAIAREGARGRTLGATKVQVRLDTGDEIRDVGLVEIIPETLH